MYGFSEYTHPDKEPVLLKEGQNIDFGIFVQNGYALFSTDDLKSLDEVYKKAKLILSYSKNIDNCIKLAFPGCENKIMKIQMFHY